MSGRRAFRWLLTGFVVVLVAACGYQAGLTPDTWWRPGAAQRVAVMLDGVRIPWDDMAFWCETGLAMIDTLAIAMLGITLALGLGFVLGLSGSRAVSGALVAGEPPAWPLRALGGGARFVALGLRCVPEVIWACILVRVVGLGPAAAIAALGLAYGGMIAKVWGEQLETARHGAATALAAGGAGPLAQLLWARLPDAVPGFAAYGVYRFECAIRASAIIGYVGGGGLGMQMEMAMAQGDFGRLGGQVVALIILVAAVEIASDRLQRKLA